MPWLVRLAIVADRRAPAHHGVHRRCGRRLLASLPGAGARPGALGPFGSPLFALRRRGAALVAGALSRCYCRAAGARPASGARRRRAPVAAADDPRRAAGGGLRDPDRPRDRVRQLRRPHRRHTRSALKLRHLAAGAPQGRAEPAQPPPASATGRTSSPPNPATRAGHMRLDCRTRASSRSSSGLFAVLVAGGAVAIAAGERSTRRPTVLRSRIPAAARPRCHPPLERPDLVRWKSSELGFQLDYDEAYWETTAEDGALRDAQVEGRRTGPTSRS